MMHRERGVSRQATRGAANLSNDSFGLEHPMRAASRRLHLVLGVLLTAATATGQHESVQTLTVLTGRRLNIGTRDQLQTARAVSTTRASFCCWSSCVIRLPTTEVENPHCGLIARRSIGT